MSTLKDMTYEKWKAMTPAERAAVRDLSGLTPQLIGSGLLEGVKQTGESCGAAHQHERFDPLLHSSQNSTHNGSVAVPHKSKSFAIDVAS